MDKEQVEEWLDGEEFHTLCMDYLGANRFPFDVKACFERLQAAILREHQKALVGLRESGEPKELWLWRNGDHYWAFDNLFPCHENGDPMTLGEPAARAAFKPSVCAQGRENETHPYALPDPPASREGEGPVARAVASMHRKVNNGTAAIYTKQGEAEEAAKRWAALDKYPYKVEPLYAAPPPAASPLRAGEDDNTIYRSANEGASNGKSASADQGIPRPDASGNRQHESGEGRSGEMRRDDRGTSSDNGAGPALGEPRQDASARGLHGGGEGNRAADHVLTTTQPDLRAGLLAAEMVHIQGDRNELITREAAEHMAAIAVAASKKFDAPIRSDLLLLDLQAIEPLKPSKVQREAYERLHAALLSGGTMSDITKAELIEFYTELRDNARRIAETKRGTDKAGWLEDARFHAAVIEAIRAKAEAKEK